MDEKQVLMQQLVHGLKQLEEQCAGLQSTVDQMVQHNSQQAQLQTELQQQHEERWVRVLMAIDELTRYVQRQPFEASALPGPRQLPADPAAAAQGAAASAAARQVAQAAAAAAAAAGTSSPANSVQQQVAQETAAVAHLLLPHQQQQLEAAIGNLVKQATVNSNGKRTRTTESSVFAMAAELVARATSLRPRLQHGVEGGPEGAVGEEGGGGDGDDAATEDADDSETGDEETDQVRTPGQFSAATFAAGTNPRGPPLHHLAPPNANPAILDIAPVDPLTGAPPRHPHLTRAAVAAPPAPTGLVPHAHPSLPLLAAAALQHHTYADALPALHDAVADTSGADLHQKPCQQPGCRSLAWVCTTGLKLYCAKHMREHGMEPLRKKCADPACDRPAEHSVQGLKLYCKDHMQRYNLDPSMGGEPARCNHPGCEHPPFVAANGATASRYCEPHMREHKERARRTCLEANCTKQPKPSIEGTSGYCRQHMRARGLTPRVPNSDRRQCQHEACEKYAQCDVNGGKIYCKAHMKVHGVSPWVGKKKLPVKALEGQDMLAASAAEAVAVAEAVAAQAAAAHAYAAEVQAVHAAHAAAAAAAAAVGMGQDVGKTVEDVTAEAAAAAAEEAAGEATE